MKYDKLSREAFLFSLAGALMLSGFLLLLMKVAKAYSHVSEPLLSWAIGFVFVSFAFTVMETVHATISAYGDEDTRVENLQLQINRAWDLLLWGNPLGWLGLLLIWQLRKSPGACLTCLAFLSIIKKID